MKRKTVLFIDDEETVRQCIAEMLKHLGYRPVVAGSGSEGLRMCKSAEVDAIIVDMFLTDMLGHELVDAVRSRGISTPIIGVTGMESDKTIKDLVCDGRISQALFKPFSIDNLRSALKKALSDEVAGRCLTKREI